MNGRLILSLGATILVIFLVVGCFNMMASPASVKEGSLEDLIRKSKKIEGFSVEVVKKNHNEKTETVRIMVQGNKIRKESIHNDDKTVEVINGETKTAFYYYPKTKSVIPQLYDKDRKVRLQDTIFYNNFEMIYQITESTVYQGIPCKIVQRRETPPEVQQRYWLREDNGFPVRLEEQYGQKMDVTEYKNLKIGPQPPGLFQTPVDGMDSKW